MTTLQTHLGEDKLFRPQLAHHRFQARPTHVVLERAQVELGRRAVEHAQPEAARPERGLLCRGLLAERDAVAGLLIREERVVDKRAVRVHLVEFAGLLASARTRWA